MRYTSPPRRFLAAAMSRSPSPRTLLMAAVLVAAVAFIGWKGAHLLSDPSVFPPDDFVEYWAAVLMAIKPHLVYLFWVALAVWAVRRPLSSRGKVIVGGLLAGAVATLVPFAANGEGLRQYWEAMTE